MEPNTGPHHRSPTWPLQSLAVSILFGICASLVWASPDPPENNRRNILVLHSYHPAVWTGEVRRGIETVFPEESGVILRHEYMDTKSFNTPEYYHSLYTLYQMKYRHSDFDAVIASDDNAYQFALAHQQDLFNNAPLIFCGVSNFDPERVKNRLVTGVLEIEPLEETLGVAMNLLPATQSVYFVTDGTTTATLNLRRLNQYLEQYHPDIEAFVLHQLTSDQMLEELSNLPEDSFAVYIAWWKDSTGRVILQEEQLNFIRNANRPVFTFSDWVIERTPSAGKCTSPFHQGKIAGELASQLLNGTDIAELPVVDDAHTEYPYLFNYTMLQRYNIPLTKLPEESYVYNEPTNKYEVPRELLWALLGGMLGLAGIVVVLFIFGHYHRQMNVILAEKEARFRGLVETTSDWIWEVDAEMFCTYNSPQAEAIMGYTPEELLGTKPYDYMTETERLRVKEHLEHFIDSGEKILKMIITVLHKQGHEVILELNGVPVYDDNGKLIAFRGVDRDITERQKQRQLLEEQRAELQSVFRASPTGIGVVIDRMLVQVNERICEITGYTEEELIGQSARMLYPTQEDYEYVGREKYRQISEQGIGTVEAKWIRKDGTVIDVLLSSSPFDMADYQKGVAFTALDITERKGIEQQLRENEAYLSSLLNTAPVGIIVLADRIIRDVNDYYCQAFGYSRHELIEQSIRMVYPTQEEYDRVGDAIYSQIRQTGRGSVEAVMCHKDGSLRNILVTGMPIDPADWNKGITFAVLDITEQKKAEEVIIRERSFSNQIIDSLPEIFYLFDQQGRFLRWNDSFETITEYSEEEVKTLSPLELFRGQDRQLIEERIADVFKTGRSSAEAKLVTKSGRIVPYYFTGRLIEFDGQPCLIGSGTDLTQLRQAEEAVRQAEQRMELALQGGDLGTWDWDVSSGTVIFNHRWAAMLGYKVAELEQSFDTWQRLVHPDDLEPVKEILNTHLQGHTDFYEAEFRLRHKAGHWVWVLSKGQLIDRDLDGNPVRVCGTHLDITDRKQAEQKLAQRLQMEHLLSNISSGFVESASEEIHQQITDSLRMISEEIGFNRLRIALFSDDHSRIYEGYSYYSEGDSPSNLKTDDMDRDIPEYAKLLRAGQVVWMSDLPNDAPPGSAMYQFCVDHNITLHLSVPMNVGQQHIGALCITHGGMPIEVNQDMVGYLQLIAEILANALVRHRTEKALAQSEQRFSSVINSSPMGVNTFKLQPNGRLELTGANDAASRILGMDVRQHLGKTLEELFSSPQATELTGIYKHICQHGGVHHGDNFDRPHEDGSGYIEFDAFQIAPNQIATMFSDVTERIQAQRELQLNQFVIDHAGEGALWVNRDGYFVYVNKALCKMLGYTRQELLTMRVPDIDPEYPDEKWYPTWEMTKELGVRHFETTHRRKDGTCIPIEITTNYVKFRDIELHCAFTRDITERKKTQEALQFTQFAIDHAGEPTFWLDQQGKLSYVNDAACKELGYTRDELLQLSIPDLDPNFPPDAWPAHWERTKKMGTRRFETQHQAKDGRLIPVEITTNFVEYGGKEYHCAFARDITARKRYENAIGDFLHTVATETGSDMFQRFAQQLCDHLNADMAIIGQIASDNSDMIRTQAVVRQGEIIDNFEYKLAGTPCERAIREKSGFCAFSDNVIQEFPNDIFLKEFGIHGYIGTPLFDQQKRPLGIICALFKNPLEGTVFSETILQIHANQAAFEMQRLREQASLERLMVQLQTQNVELESVKATMEASLEQSPAGILIAEAPDVKLRFANRAAFVIHGKPDAEISGAAFEENAKTWKAFTADGDPLPLNQTALFRAIQQGQITRNEELIIEVEDGTRRWVLANAAPIRNDRAQIISGIAIFYDITLQKQTEEALKESEAKHRLLFTSANDAILIMNDQVFLECNPKAVEIYGCRDYADLVGKSPVEFSPTHQEDGRFSSEKAKEFLSAAMAGTPQRFPWVHKRLDGTRFYVEVSLARLELYGQHLIQAVVRDVTERRLAEQAREKLMRELEAKNEELESIVFIASHDLRSPLVNIRGFTGELEKSLQQLRKLVEEAEYSDKAKKQLEFLFNVDMPESMNFIKLGNRKMDILLNGLLRLSRIGTAKVHPEKLDMDQMFSNLINSVQFQMKEHNIAITVQRNLPDCLGDSVLVNQVFNNLIDNSIKYRHPDRPGQIKISAKSEGKAVVYTVADNGIGIAEEHLSKVFDIFHQLNPTVDKAGEGLGLTIVRRILDRQEGTIRIESSPNVGTTIYVRLPKA